MIINFIRSQVFIPQFLKSDAVILSLASIGIYLVLFFKLISSPEKHLAKVDFLTIYDQFLLSRQRFGFFQDNFGIPWPIRNTGEMVYYIDGLSFWFPYKDLLIYFVVPALIGAVFFYKYYSHLASNSFQLSDAKFIGVASSCFIFFSPILIYVFEYGWSVPMYWALAGVSAALHFGVRIQVEEKNPTIWIAFYIAAALAGIVMHFLLLVAFMLFSRKHLGKFFLLLSVLFIANSYYIVPELFKTLNLGFGYYQGVDPTVDALKNFRAVPVYTRFALLPNTGGFADVNYLGLMLITVLALFGILLTFYNNKSFKIIHFLVISLCVIIFPNDIFGFSVYKLLIDIPSFGGMFRDIAKISVLAVISFAFFSSVAVAKLGKTGRLIFMALVIINCGFYVEKQHSKMFIKGFDLPKSYHEAYVAIDKYTKPTERVLLLPFPNWFHRYHWNDGVQVQNLFRGGLNRYAVSGESIPPHTIPPEIWKNISKFQKANADCEELKKIAYQFGIGAIVLQKDIISVDGKSLEVNEIQQNFDRCEFKSIYTAELNNVYLLKSRPLMEFCNSIDQRCVEASFKNWLFGTVAKITPPIHFDQFHLNYRYIAHSFGLISDLHSPIIYGEPSSGTIGAMGYSWANLEDNQGGASYYLVNTTALTSLLSHVITILGLIGLAVWVFIYYLIQRLK